MENVKEQNVIVLYHIKSMCSCSGAWLEEYSLILATSIYDTN